MARGTIVRKNVRCCREIAYLLAQGASCIIVNGTDGTTHNLPTPSTVTAAALERQTEIEKSLAARRRTIDYQQVMSWSSDVFAEKAGLPSPKSIGGEKFMLSLSGATLIRALDLDCASLTTSAFACSVKPEFAIRLAIRLLLIAAQGEDKVPTLPAK